MGDLISIEENTASTDEDDEEGSEEDWETDSDCMGGRSEDEQFDEVIDR